MLFSGRMEDLERSQYNPSFTWNFRAVVESYDLNQNHCLVSSLSFHATKINMVICINREVNCCLCIWYNVCMTVGLQSSCLLHVHCIGCDFLSIVPGAALGTRPWFSEFLQLMFARAWAAIKKQDLIGWHDTCSRCYKTHRQLIHTMFDLNADITLDHLTVVPVSLSTVVLEWKVIPTGSHHCITSYNIQVSGPVGSQWMAQTPGKNNSFLLSGMQLEPLKEYTYCVTANIPSTHVSPTVKQTSNVTLQGMHHKSY